MLRLELRSRNHSLADLLRAGRGALLCYRFFDVGDQIALAEVERLLRASGGWRRFRFTREGAEALDLAAPPLDVELGPRSLVLPKMNRTIEALASARIYEYGAVSIRFEIPIEADTPLQALIPLADELYDSPVLDEAGRQLYEKLLPRIERAIETPHHWHGDESYTVIFVEELRGGTVDELLAAPWLPNLIVGEPEQAALSDQEHDDVRRHAYRYGRSDVAIVDWNSALVVEPGGSRDIPDLLEYATSQLLELRYYDDLFDRELQAIHGELGRVKRRRIPALIFHPYGRLARRVQERFLELAEFTERVDNAVKVVGDFYLARVYSEAVERFRIPAWQRSIDRKQQLVMQVYELLKGDVEVRRASILETTIIVLIVLEIVMALTGVVKG